MNRIIFDDWLAVSTDGFASMNAGRQPAHLVKELIQNALDALGNEGGSVELECKAGERPDTVHVTCRDDGTGMEDLAQIRTVFWTSKTDSHLKRGRMGRGFKEMLCLAHSAAVTSGGRTIRFAVEAGKRVTQMEKAPFQDAGSGTTVEMEMPWQPAIIGDLEAYFRRLLPPANVKLAVNDVRIEPRQPAHRVDATLPTELFEQGKWVRPARKTVVELVPVGPGEEPSVYELGIPVCPAEWTQPYHADVLQRVPMNPGRDAVASGYLLKIHRACLLVLLPQMNGEQVREDWVGNAVVQCDETVQREVIRRGFGENIARSVPKMGVRQYDEDARDIGVDVINTRQTSGGFREILSEHVPTTKQAVDQRNQELLSAAAQCSFSVSAAFAAQDRAAAQQRRLIEAAGGKEHVQTVMDFARWFCQKLLDGYGGPSVCSVTIALLKAIDAIATWSETDVLTLGIDTPWLWSDPLGEESLATYVHEVAHHLNAHHGRDFHKEVERLAGRAARVMLVEADHVRRQFARLLNPAA